MCRWVLKIHFLLFDLKKIVEPITDLPKSCSKIVII